MGHHGRRRLAGRHGRLAAARRTAGRDSWIRDRRNFLLPIGYVYGQWVKACQTPPAKSPTPRKYFRAVSFGTGWIMMLAYFIVCPWEAVAVRKTRRLPLSIARFSAALQRRGAADLSAARGYRAGADRNSHRAELPGIRLSAIFQNWTAFGTLGLFVIFVACGVSKGCPQNLPPLFTHSAFVSILLVIQIVPYFMTGFESVDQGGGGSQSRDSAVADSSRQSGWRSSWESFSTRS